MKKIQCLVVDDEPLAIALLKDHISRTHFLELSFSTTNPLKALEKLKQEHFDLIFLDIQMPALNGMDFLKILDKKCSVILTTAYADYALESYDHDVMDYLLKPISFERFYKSVLKVVPPLVPIAVAEVDKKDIPKYMFIKTDGEQIKIAFDELLFIESLRDYVNFKTSDKEYIVLENLKDIIQMLPDHFMRVHRSYIINLNKISSVAGNRIKVNSQNIPVGETFKNTFQHWLKNKSSLK